MRIFGPIITWKAFTEGLETISVSINLGKHIKGKGIAESL